MQFKKITGQQRAWKRRNHWVWGRASVLQADRNLTRKDALVIANAEWDARHPNDIHRRGKSKPKRDRSTAAPAA